ncbi:phytanoyl-CoA dioxygenase, peroxisomal-like isoform X2 [Oscarella lobularis]
MTDANNPSFRQNYKDDGFVVVDNLLTPSEVKSLKDEMLDICSGKRGRISGVTPSSETATEAEILDKYLAIHFPHKISDHVQSLVRESKTVDVLRQCIGPNVKCMQTMMFMKGPGKRGQACHQDEYYIPTRDRSLCASWIALDDATIENGCLWVIPGSHRKGIIYPMKNDVDERFDSSGCSYGHGYSESAWKPVELKSGSSVFFNGYLLHRSLANKSKGFRRAFANHYMSAESLLPWTNDGRFEVGDDMRDVLMVCGEDPYAKFKPLQDVTKPFVRAEVRQKDSVFNEIK